MFYVRRQNVLMYGYQMFSCVETNVLMCGYQMSLRVWRPNVLMCVETKCPYVCGDQMSSCVWRPNVHMCVETKWTNVWRPNVLMCGDQMSSCVETKCSHVCEDQMSSCVWRPSVLMCGDQMSSCVLRPNVLMRVDQMSSYVETKCPHVCGDQMFSCVWRPNVLLCVGPNVLMCVNPKCPLCVWRPNVLMRGDQMSSCVWRPNVLMCVETKCPHACGHKVQMHNCYTLVDTVAIFLAKLLLLSLTFHVIFYASNHVTQYIKTIYFIIDIQSHLSAKLTNSPATNRPNLCIAAILLSLGHGDRKKSWRWEGPTRSPLAVRGGGKWSPVMYWQCRQYHRKQLFSLGRLVGFSRRA